MMSKLANLEELVEKCKNDESKELISEALGCYHAKSYRSAIICIWQAVAFDFTHKVKHMHKEGINNNEITKFIDALKDVNNEITNANAHNFIPKAMNLERSITLNIEKNTGRFLEKILKLNANEAREIETLYLDRHRCAHPALYDKHPHDFKPELVHYHFRNAVDYVLAKNPYEITDIYKENLANFINNKYINEEDQINNYIEGYLLSAHKPKDIISHIINELESITKSSYNNIEFKKLIKTIKNY